MAEILGTSRFRDTNLIKTRRGAETFGLVEGFDALRDMSGDQFTFLTIPNGLEGRPDLISFEVYGNVRLSWVIVLGEVIKIPTSQFVRSLF